MRSCINGGHVRLFNPESEERIGHAGPIRVGPMRAEETSFYGQFRRGFRRELEVACNRFFIDRGLPANARFQ